MFQRKIKTGGADRVRTCDPHNAIVVLYQLSYDPIQSARNLNTRPRLSKGFSTSRDAKMNPTEI
jgi:hypothetical protein